MIFFFLQLWNPLSNAQEANRSGDPVWRQRLREESIAVVGIRTSIA